MVHEFVALLLLDPLEHRKVDDPQERELRDRAGSRGCASLQAQLASMLRRRLVLRRPPSAASRRDRRRASVQRARIAVLAGGLERRALDARLGARAHTSPAAPSCLACSIELVELACARYRAAPGTTKPRTSPPASIAPGRRRSPESSNAADRSSDLHAATQVRLVRAVRRDRLGVRHPQERRRRVAADQAISRPISGSIIANTSPRSRTTSRGRSA